MAIYKAGDKIGQFGTMDLIVSEALTPVGGKVVTQVFTGADGRDAFVMRGKGLMLAANTDATKISGFTDADAEQFLESDQSKAGAVGGYAEPVGLTFADLEITYKDGDTNIYQKKVAIPIEPVNPTETACSNTNNTNNTNNQTMATTYTKGQSLGTLFNSPLIVETPLTPANSKVVAQVITAKDGKTGYVFRGKAVMLASKPAATKVSGFVDADAEQFLASDSETGFNEPTGLSFSDLEVAYTDEVGTKIWQKKADIAATKIEQALTEKGIDGTTIRSASLGEQLTAFVSKNIWVILGIGALIFFVWRSSGKRKSRRGRRGFSFGI